MRWSLLAAVLALLVACGESVPPGAGHAQWGVGFYCNGVDDVLLCRPFQPCFCQRPDSTEYPPVKL